ncbi:hypothetical protein JCM6882_001403 [Rhodosporidiobolus microsporus]
MQSNIPNTYRAATFSGPNSGISIREVETKQPRENEMLVKVHSVALSSTDQLVRNDLVPGINYPVIPSSALTGTIVKLGPRSTSGGSHAHFKEGQKVAAVTFKGALGEYARVHCDSAVEIKSGQFKGEEEEAAIYAFDAGRIWGSYLRCEREHKAMDNEERRIMHELNQRIGFGKEEGVIVVYGEGGFARLAINVLDKFQRTGGSSMISSLVGSGHSAGRTEYRVVLVATSDRFSAKDYNIDEKDMLVVDRHNIAQELKQRGGAAFVVCTEQVDQNRGAEALLDGCRYGASINVLSPTRDGKVQLPIANVIAKALRISGGPILTHSLLDRTLELAQKNNLNVRTKKFRFDEQQLDQAWRSLENPEVFEAPLVIVNQQ